MALSFVSSGVAANSFDANAITPPIPSGVADDDIVILFVDVANAAETKTWPSGFTELFDTSHDGGSFAAAWKRASSETGPYSISWTTPCFAVAISLAIRGAITSATPVVAGTTSTGSDNSPDPPSTDPGSSANRLAVALYGIEGKNGYSASPSGYTHPSNSDGVTSGGGSPTGHCGAAFSYRTYTGQAENPGVFTAAGADGWAANTLVFTPEPAGGTATPVLAANTYRQRRV